MQIKKYAPILTPSAPRHCFRQVPVLPLVMLQTGMLPSLRGVELNSIIVIVVIMIMTLLLRLIEWSLPVYTLASQECVLYRWFRALFA